MKVLYALVIMSFILFVIFCGMWIYGIIKDIKEHNRFGTSKYVWIGLIGLNACNVCMQICNLIRLSMK